MLNKIEFITKRDGSKAPFDENKIAMAIFKAAKATEGSNLDMATAENLARKVSEKLKELNY